MKLTKLFSYPIDQGGLVTRNYIKLFSNCTPDDLSNYYRYLYQNKMYSELGNFTDALRLFAARYNGWNIFKLIRDRIQRNRAAAQIKQARRDRDAINEARKVDGVRTGLIDKATGQEWIAAPGVDLTDKVGYGDNPAEKAAWDILNGFNDTRGKYNSHGEMNKLDLSAANKALNSNQWNDKQFYKTIQDDATKRNDYQGKVMENVMADKGKIIDDAVVSQLQKQGDIPTPPPHKPVRRITVGKKSPAPTKPVHRIVVGKKTK